MNTYNSDISVIMAVYNGSKYIIEQIESIINQTIMPKELIFIDDCSTDDSIRIINEHLSDKNKISYKIIKNKINSGYIKSFGYGLEEASCNYIALSDQDDVWHRNKLETLLQEMHNLEGKYGNKPFLVFSDVSVVDDKLNILFNSFNKLHKFRSKRNNINFKNICLHNVAPGMSMLINKELKKTAVPFPEDIAQHDWWLILLCSLIGKVSYIDKPLVLYRQHGANSFGANPWIDLVWFRLVLNNIYKKKMFNIGSDFLMENILMLKNYIQTKTCKQLEALDNRITVKNKLVKKIYQKLYKGGISSVLWMILHGINAKDWRRKLFYYFAILIKK